MNSFSIKQPLKTIGNGFFTLTGNVLLLTMIFVAATQVA